MTTTPKSVEYKCPHEGSRCKLGKHCHVLETADRLPCRITALETSFVRTNMNADAFLDNFPEAVRNSLTSVEKNTAYDKVWMPSSTECASGYYKFLFAEIDERKARFSGNGGGFRNGIRISSDGKYYPGYSWSELGTNSNNPMILGFAIGVTPTE